MTATASCLQAASSNIRSPDIQNWKDPPASVTELEPGNTEVIEERLRDNALAIATFGKDVTVSCLEIL